MQVVVSARGEEWLQRAEELAARLELPLVQAPEVERQTPEASLLVGERLELVDGRSGSAPVSVEFRPLRPSALLRRAALAGRKPPPTVVDATAGLGQDGFALACAGCRVELIERSPVLAALLADGLDRARASEPTREAAERIGLHVGESRELLQRLEPPDVVYLDPMYPRSGREGRKSKEMRLLRELLGDDSDADELLSIARCVAVKRVAVKRPIRAPFLAAVRPSGKLVGTTVRYDLYAPLVGGSEAAGS